MRIKLMCLIVALWWGGCTAVAAESPDMKSSEESTPNLPPTTVVYKSTPQGELELEYFLPAGQTADARRPAVLFFFGGGWNNGQRGHLEPQARHLAQRGIVGITADYRTKNGHGTSPFECVKDAISAMRFVRQHAADYGIDPERIGAGGGSAGGHLAMALSTVTAPWLIEEDDKTLDFRPGALVLFNPVYNNSPAPTGYGHERVGEKYLDFSPAHNLHADMPPTLVMLGDRDNLIPVSTAERVRDSMVKLGVRSELVIYPSQGHGFFNPNLEQMDMYQATVAEMDRFLVSLRWLSPIHD